MPREEQTMHHWMPVQRWLTVSAAVLCFTLLSGRLAAQPQPEDIDPLSVDEFGALLEAHKGQVTLVNLWATWCAPCLREIPELLELEAHLGDRGFRLIAISLDDVDATATIREFRDEWFPTLKTWHNTTEDWFRLIASLEPNWSGVLPTSFLLDRDGNLVATITGGKDYAAFEAAITPLL
jgi:thiol-disulfide isomerase/thioredoxin